MSELNNYLKTDSDPDLDFITFSGSGEPTLHNGIGEIIEFIKEKYPNYKIAILTNSTLLYREDVRNDLLNADVIIPSLDAVSEEVFNKINRPASGISALKIINGIKELKKEYPGRLIIEIFLVAGLNTEINELKKLKIYFLK